MKSQRNDSFGVSTLKSDGEIASTSKEKASKLNQQFSSVFTDEKEEDFPCLGNSPHPTMPDIIISSAGVEKLLLGLNPSKAAGPDAIPARFLKATAVELAPILTQLFQQSLQTGIVPEDWRTANVAPVFKKGDRCQQATIAQCPLLPLSAR